MNEIDAVSPQFYESYKDISDFLADFGPYNGRYVANYPVNWEKQFLDQLSDLSTMEQKKAKELLKRNKYDGIQAALIDRNLKFDDSISWIKNVEILQTKKIFNDVVAGTYDENTNFKKWPEKLQYFRENRLRSAHLKGSASEYIAIIEPLLKKGPVAYFIDPHFRPNDDPSIDFIKRLFEKISNSSCYDIIFYIRKDKALAKVADGKDFYTEVEYKDKLIEIFHGSQCIPKNMSLTINLVENFSENKVKEDANLHNRLHNRFFLTLYGAIDFGMGFKPQSYKTAQIPVYLVDKRQHLELVNWYISEKFNFKSRLSITIKSNR